MLVRLLAAVFAASALTAPAAHSANCFGSNQTYRVCAYPENVSVDPAGGSTVGDCFWIITAECVPIFVTLPSATTSEPLVSTECGTLTC